MTIAFRLWADMELFRSLGSGFRGDRAKLTGGDFFAWLGIIVVSGLALALLSKLIARQERRRRFNNPRALFRDLCRAHQLDRTTRTLLRRLARHWKLPQPA